MKRLLFLSSFAALGSACGALNSSLEIDGDQAVLTGTLGARTYEQVEALLDEHPEVTTIVFADVPGSINDEVNMQTGQMIRAAGLATHARDGAEIASGGVDLFCAGATRTMGEGVSLGVHSWQEGLAGKEATDYPDGDPAHDAQVDYFTEMLGEGGADFYYFTIHAAPADGIHWMSDDEIAAHGLLTD